MQRTNPWGRVVRVTGVVATLIGGVVVAQTPSPSAGQASVDKPQNPPGQAAPPAAPNQPPQGRGRYYSGMLQFLALLHATGNFRVY